MDEHRVPHHNTLETKSIDMLALERKLQMTQETKTERKEQSDSLSHKKKISPE